MKGFGFILWQARHLFYHVLLGLVWAWYLRERWGELNARWIWWSLFGSLVPDLDHLFYFLSWGKHDWYTQEIKNLFRSRQWREGALFISKGHKHNTNLALHNYYTVAILLGLSLLSSLYEWHLGVILFGAMIIHYLFDIADDLLTLGSVNPNWKRLGRPKVARK